MQPLFAQRHPGFGRADIARFLHHLRKGHPAEFFAGWRASAELHTSIFVEDGAAVWWILNPQVPPGALFDSIAGINQIYRDVAETGPNVELIDLYTPFGGDDSGCTMRSPDCTHLDDAGIALFRTAVVNALD